MGCSWPFFGEKDGYGKRGAPKICRKICQRFVTRKLSFGKSRATHPGPPKTRKLLGVGFEGFQWLPGSSYRGATEHPQISGVKSLRRGVFSTNMAPPRWPRVFFFSLKIPSSAGRQDSRMPNMEPSFWGELFLSIALMAAMASRE